MCRGGGRDSFTELDEVSVNVWDDSGVDSARSVSGESPIVEQERWLTRRFYRGDDDPIMTFQQNDLSDTMDKPPNEG
jgi:hypothetical protein